MDQNPSTYDKHHSKMWNKQVNQQALAIEEDIKKQEDKEDAEREAYESAKEEKRQAQIAKEEQAQKEKDEIEANKKARLAQQKKSQEYSTKNQDVDL